MILIIDDEPALLTALSRIFTRRGEVALTAETVGQAVDAVLTFGGEISAIVCDWNLPDGVGEHVYDGLPPELRERFVLFSSDPQGIAHMTHRGVTAVFKPGIQDVVEAALTKAWS